MTKHPRDYIPWSGRRELKALQRINHAINVTLDLGEVLQRIIAETVPLLAARSGSVILWEEDAKEAELVTSYGSAPLLRTLRYPLAGSLAGWIAEHKRPLRVLRLTPAEWPDVWRLKEQLDASPTSPSVLLVPLWARGKVIGCLEAVWDPSHLISSYEERLLESVAIQAAIAITNARLYQEKEQALAALQSAHRRATNILESITDAFYALDRQWRFTYLNTQAERLLRRTQTELLGKNAWEEFPEAVSTVTHEKFHQAMTEQKTVDFEVFHPPFAAWFQVSAYPSRNGLAVYFRDVTAHRREQEELRRTKEAAEAAGRAKDEFLATMSHELRTPLGIILGYTGLLLDDASARLEKEHTQFLCRIDHNARELLDLITSVLDLSRLEAGRLPLEVRETRVPSVLQEIRAETQSLQEQTPLAFAWEAAPTLPVLYTDTGKLKVILKNLIGNAIRFTLNGSITVTAREARSGVEINVADTGIGIAPEAFALIFEPFQQVERPVTGKDGGAGLGLHIVKRLIDVLGGTVAVESEVGRGSTFRVWLPLRRDA